MDLQDLFYIVATVFMVVVLGLLLAIALVVYYIRKRLMMLAFLTKKPAKAAAEVGAGLVEGIAYKITDWLSTRNTKKVPR
jgi:hypothetical protein